MGSEYFSACAADPDSGRFYGTARVGVFIDGGECAFKSKDSNIERVRIAAMSSSSGTEEKKEVYLEADKEIPGQHYCCLSFISPQKVLKNKDAHFFSEFLKDYEVQYKIKATESFIMAEANKVQDAGSRVQDILENLILKTPALAADLSGSLETVKSIRAGLTRGMASDLEAHVKSNMSDFKTSVIEEAYDTFMYKNKKRMEEEFFAKNEFRTTVQGLKVRGVYDTYAEAAGRAKTLQKLDSSFNVYVGQVGFWLPWDPEPHDVADQEYADDQLNTLMKKYKENESQRDEFFAKTKSDKLGGSRIGGAQFGGAGGESSAPPADMFAGEDLAIARKREAAAAAPTNTLVGDNA
jgi:hypothetical protein